MILLIDNYDSFSYNLYQLIGETEPDIRVIRNDELTVGGIGRLAPDRIVISPGPGRPEDAGVITDVVRELGSSIPILGVCLGHQAVFSAYGGSITYAKKLMHGKQSVATFDRESPLFRGCPEKAPVARYHSLAADASTLPACLRVTALADDGEIMAVEHKKYSVFGVQFHPESILTPSGRTIINNFIDQEIEK